MEERKGGLPSLITSANNEGMLMDVELYITLVTIVQMIIKESSGKMLNLTM